MRGKIKRISVPRRLIDDMMCASAGVPFVSLRRRLDIRELLEARAEAARPPGWAAIFVKAFGLVAKEQPVLRTLYARWPWPHFYELPCSIAMVAVARVLDGEDCVLPQKIRLEEDPQSLAEIDQLIRLAKDAPIDEIGAFRKMLRAAAAPMPLRRVIWAFGLTVLRQRANYFGSFGVTSVAAYGGGELSALSPGPYILSYGTVGPDQTIDVLIRWDHRVTDGAPIAKALTRLEQVLNGEIAAELRSLRRSVPVRSVST
jgi:hypothetical protein